MASGFLLTKTLVLDRIPKFRVFQLFQTGLVSKTSSISGVCSRSMHIFNILTSFYYMFDSFYFDICWHCYISPTFDSLAGNLWMFFGRLLPPVEVNMFLRVDIQWSGVWQGSSSRIINMSHFLDFLLPVLAYLLYLLWKTCRLTVYYFLSRLVSSDPWACGRM